MNHVTPAPGWTAEDARTRFDELARRAQEEGPQCVALPDGSSILVSPGSTAAPPRAEHDIPLSEFLSSPYVEGLDLERDYAEGEEPDLGL